MACLLNSMQPEIGKLFLYLSTAKEMWKTPDLSVTAYYNTLKVLWQELDHHQQFIMITVEDAALLQKKWRVYSNVHTDKSRQSAMMGTVAQETSALKAVQENNPEPPMNHSKQWQRKPRERRPDGVITAISQGIPKKPAGS
ncbi:hypothetical protein CK203_090636 [Vitis vinifera]|uniref:Retrotransposon gag domain-containing protein n=1 Tax=Vitis vinifera TaxID=29760 RepID=A0A438DW41_VITVI|nr:hypothetical protein CK203_090636 [Vitis vinifera]